MGGAVLVEWNSLGLTINNYLRTVRNSVVYEWGKKLSETNDFWFLLAYLQQ